VKEHAKATVTLDKNSLLAKHHVLYSHAIDFENMEIGDKDYSTIRLCRGDKDYFLKRGIPWKIKIL